MGTTFLIIIIAIVAILAFRLKRSRKSLAQQTKEFNQEYYADKQPRQFN
jgi:hypothetical protein